jgi:dihydroflavonol-4-reductase
VKILVTGATGLIGIHAVNEMLDQGRSVRVLVRDREKLAQCLRPFGKTLAEVEVVSGDILDRGSVDAAVAGCDAAVHCAGLFSNELADRQLLQQVNVTGSDNVLRAALRAGLDPVIHVSSYLALFPPGSDMHRADDPVTEPASMYASTKAAAEKLARGLQAEGAPVVIVYPGSVQGPHDPTFGIGSQLIQQAIKTRRWLVTEGGRGYTDVRDLVQLLDRALVPGLGPRRFMAGGYYLSYAESLQILRSVSGVDIKARNIPGWLLRVMGSAADQISRLTGKTFLMTREAAEVLTRSVPSDDQPALEQLRLTQVGAEASFRDLVQWMRDSKRL